MISYWKTQWFNIVAGCVYLGISIYNFCTGNVIWGIAWCLPAVVWFTMSHVNYNDERIKLLEKKQERDDAMFELVQELRKANEIDRKIDAEQEQRIKKLEERVR